MKFKNIIFISYVSLIFLVFSSCKKENPNVSLQDNSWKVVKIRKNGDHKFSKATKLYLIDFTSDTTFTLKQDVNVCEGIYKISGLGKIEMKGLACTLICCESDFAIELAQLIQEMTSYYMKGDYLFFKGNGEIVLEPI